MNVSGIVPTRLPVRNATWMSLVPAIVPMFMRWRWATWSFMTRWMPATFTTLRYCG